MSETIRAHGGTLDKYMGDGILAFFGDADPEGGGEEAEEARIRVRVNTARDPAKGWRRISAQGTTSRARHGSCRRLDPVRPSRLS